MIGPATREGGFTILELLVALILLSLLAIGLAGSMRIGLGQWGAIEARARAAPPVAAAQDAVRALLAAAVPALAGEARNRRVAFQGGPDGVAFIGALPPRAAAPGLNALSLSLDRAAGALVLSWRPFPSDRAGDAKILVDGVRDVRFAYFGAAEDGGIAGWSDHWSEAAATPRLVRVSLDFLDGRQSWPDLSVALPARPEPSRPEPAAPPAPATPAAPTAPPAAKGAG